MGTWALSQTLILHVHNNVHVYLCCCLSAHFQTTGSSSKQGLTTRCNFWNDGGGVVTCLALLKAHKKNFQIYIQRTGFQKVLIYER